MILIFNRHIDFSMIGYDFYSSWLLFMKKIAYVIFTMRKKMKILKD